MHPDWSIALLSLNPLSWLTHRKVVTSPFPLWTKRVTNISPTLTLCRVLVWKGQKVKIKFTINQIARFAVVESELRFSQFYAGTRELRTLTITNVINRLNSFGFHSLRYQLDEYLFDQTCAWKFTKKNRTRSWSRFKPFFRCKQFYADSVYPWV